MQEATAKRMFEDAQTLRENLTEIRGEIDRIFVNAEREQSRGKEKGRTFTLRIPRPSLTLISVAVVVNRIHCYCTRLDWGTTVIYLHEVELGSK